MVFPTLLYGGSLFIKCILMDSVGCVGRCAPAEREAQGDPSPGPLEANPGTPTGAGHQEPSGAKLKEPSGEPTGAKQKEPSGEPTGANQKEPSGEPSGAKRREPSGERYTYHIYICPRAASPVSSPLLP